MLTNKSKNINVKYKENNWKKKNKIEEKYVKWEKTNNRRKNERKHMKGKGMKKKCGRELKNNEYMSCTLFF